MGTDEVLNILGRRQGVKTNYSTVMEMTVREKKRMPCTKLSNKNVLIHHNDYSFSLQMLVTRIKNTYKAPCFVLWSCHFTVALVISPTEYEHLQKISILPQTFLTTGYEYSLGLTYSIMGLTHSSCSHVKYVYAHSW